MSFSDKPNKIEKYWEGIISGTNRGKIILSIEGAEKTLNAEGIFFDQQLGSSVFKLSGSIEDNSAKMFINDIQGLFGFHPLTGEVNLTFTKDFKSAEGQWKSDIGTTGSLKISSFPNQHFNWVMTWWWNQIKIFLSQKCKTIFILFYLTIFILVLLGSIVISFALLILLFTPGLFIFKYEIRGLVEALGLKKFAGAEFQEIKPIPAPSPTMPPSLSTEIDKILYLDIYFVRRTKMLLIWLGEKDSVDGGQLIKYANFIGIPDLNIKDTLLALSDGGCIKFEDNKYKLSDFGKKYFKHLMARL